MKIKTIGKITLGLALAGAACFAAYALFKGKEEDEEDYSSIPDELDDENFCIDPDCEYDAVFEKEGETLSSDTDSESEGV